jgi:hypothetical protein
VAVDPVVRPAAGNANDITLAKSGPRGVDIYVGPSTPTQLGRQRLDKTLPPSGPPATITGTLATTNANDTVVASGTAGAAPITGTLATTNADDTLVASGTSGSTPPPAAQGGGSIREYVYLPVTRQSIDDDEVALILALVG